MSIHVVAWVLKHSTARLGDRLVLIVLADHANADGTGAWPSVETIAHEAGLSERQAHRSLRRLEGAGEIVRTGVSHSGTIVYKVVIQGVPNWQGVTNTTGFVSDLSPEPSFEPSSTSLSSNGAELRESESGELVEFNPRSFRLQGMGR